MSPSRLLIGGTLLLITAAFTSALWDRHRSREQTLREEEAEITNLARALAGETARAIDAVAALLQDIAPLAHQRALTADALHARLLTAAGVDGIAWFDPSGKLLAHAGTGATVTPGLPRGSGGGVFVNALPGTQPGRFSLLVARPVPTAAGQPAGTLVAAMNRAHFDRIFSAIRLPGGGLVDLYGNDGRLLLRAPQGQTTAATDAPPALATALANHAPALVRLAGQSDQDRLVVALQPVNDSPLTVGVSMSEAAALAPLRAWSQHLVLRWVAISTVLFGLVLIVVRELKRREAADARVRESEERYALAMAGSQEGHWDWDVVRGTVFLSARLMQLMGRPSEDLVTDDRWIEREAMFDDADRQRRRQALDDHFRGRTAHYELEYRIRNGAEPRWLLDRGLALRDASGKVQRMAGGIMDVTERKLAAAEQAHLEQRLREAEKLEALGTLAGGIAHDFNNILGAILGYGDMANRAAPDGSVLQRHTGNVLTAAHRAKALVDQILDYSRSQHGPRDPVDVRTVAAETLDLLRASLREDIRLQVDCDAGALVVLCDPTQMHQVLMNLCTNAIQAMPAGGTLNVALHREDLPGEQSLSHGTLLAGPYVRLSVSDTGVGMDRDLIKRVFEPFFTTKAAGKGTGLGLALVHNIVADLGGAIDVHSVPGQGTRFSIYLPRFDAPARSGMPAAGTSKSGSGQRVLVVEDDNSQLLIAEEMLAALSYEPVGFIVPREAVAALATEPTGFDAAVIDYVLPGTTGIELTRRLHEHRPDLPVVLLSGYRGPLLDREAKAAGIVQVLGKPLAAEALAAALAAITR